MRVAAFLRRQRTLDAELREDFGFILAATLTLLGLVIGFSFSMATSRVVPDLLVSTDPGDLFVMRNVGNMVPPATVEGASTGDLSEASAIEYAVLVLQVPAIVVCGHSECGAMKAALTSKPMDETPNLAKWLHHATSATFRLENEGPLDCHRSPHDQLSQLNVLVQLEHLMT